jgi:hypothetical protein
MCEQADEQLFLAALNEMDGPRRKTPGTKPKEVFVSGRELSDFRADLTEYFSRIDPGCVIRYVAKSYCIVTFPTMSQAVEGAQVINATRFKGQSLKASEYKAKSLEVRE